MILLRSRRVQTIEVIGAEIRKGHAIAKHVASDDEEAVRDRRGCAL